MRSHLIRNSEIRAAVKLVNIFRWIWMLNLHEIRQNTEFDYTSHLNSTMGENVKQTF